MICTVKSGRHKDKRLQELEGNALGGDPSSRQLVRFTLLEIGFVQMILDGE